VRELFPKKQLSPEEKRASKRRASVEIDPTGKFPTCSELRTRRTLRNLTNTKTGENHWVDFGCGKIYFCESCGETHAQLISKRFSNLILSIGAIRPKLQILSMIFTLPDDARIFKTYKTERDNYPLVFSAVQSAIETHLPKAGYVLALHNWSSADPRKKHIHIHALYICLTQTGSEIKEKKVIPIYDSFSGFLSTEKIDAIKNGTKYTDSNGNEQREHNGFRHFAGSKKEPVIEFEYFKLNDTEKRRAKLFNKIRYDLRSPIGDLIKAGFKKMPADYVRRMRNYEHCQHIKYYGFLGNNTKTKFLKNVLGIEKIKEKNWILNATAKVSAYDTTNETTILETGEIINNAEIKTLSDIALDVKYKIDLTKRKTKLIFFNDYETRKDKPDRSSETC
jgi:hypothetical protein